MNCLECQEVFQRRLDGETIDLAPDLHEHLAQCPSCRVLYLSGKTLLRGLKVLPPPTVPLDFSKRMTGLVLADRRSRRRRVRLRLVITAALAACVLVMALAGDFLLPVPRSVPSRPNPLANDSKKETPEIAPINDPEESPHLAQSVANARDALVSISERWADNAREQTRILVSAANAIEVPGIDNLPERTGPFELEPAAQALQQTGQGVAESLQPVTKSARRAFAYFVRELPVLEGYR